MSPPQGNGYDYDPGKSFAATEDGWIDFTQTYGKDKPPTCGTPRTMTKKAKVDTIWYCGWDGYLHAFLNPKIYFTWYASFNGVKVVADSAIDNLAKGEPVQYRPGVRLIKAISSNKVYAVERDEVLRLIPDEAAAKALYGAAWAKRVDDVPTTFFKYYDIGPAIAPTGTR